MAPRPRQFSETATPHLLVHLLAGKVHVLTSDPKDGLAAALARLGRAFMARDS
jgi:hypothetical protein